MRSPSDQHSRVPRPAPSHNELSEAAIEAEAAGLRALLQANVPDFEQTRREVHLDDDPALIRVTAIDMRVLPGDVLEFDERPATLASDARLRRLAGNHRGRGVRRGLDRWRRGDREGLGVMGPNSPPTARSSRACRAALGGPYDNRTSVGAVRGPLRGMRAFTRTRAIGTVKDPERATNHALLQTRRGAPRERTRLRFLPAGVERGFAMLGAMWSPSRIEIDVDGRRGRPRRSKSMVTGRGGRSRGSNSM